MTGRLLPMKRLIAVAAVAAVLMPACSQLGGLGVLVQPPRFSVAEGYDAEVRVLGPSAQRPLGGAAIRLYARVENPNSFGLNLTRLAGDLFLEGARAAVVDFPLGLPLSAQQDTVIPIELGVSFSDVGELADVAAQIVSRNRVAYRLDGTLTLEAGALGQPSFGPQTWLQGSATVFR